MSDEGHGGLDGFEEAAEAAEVDGFEEAAEAAEVDREGERDRLLEVWGRNKRAVTGTIVACPVCSHTFRKTRGSHVFCRNNGSKCKDRFWNTVNDERRERAIMFDRR